MVGEMVADSPMDTHPATPVKNGRSSSRSSAALTPRTVAGWMDRGRSLLEQKTMSDVTFEVGQNGGHVTIPGHKFILSLGSPVFQQIFYGPGSSLSTESTIVRLGDTSPAAFRNLLRFLYTEEVKLEDENAVATLALGRRYQVPSLVEAMESFLQHQITAANASLYLAQASAADEVQLVVLCLTKLSMPADRLLKSSEFLELNQRTLCELLKSDWFAARIVQLCAALNRWAECACAASAKDPTAENKREQLGEALTYVRFADMTAEELVEGPVKDGLLPIEKALEMLKERLGMAGSVKQPASPDSSEKRPAAPVEYAHINRFSSTLAVEASMNCCLALPHWIGIQCNRPLLLHGVGLYNSMENTAVSVLVFRRSTSDLVASATATLESAVAGPELPNRPVTFDAPLRIEPFEQYEICATYIKGLPRLRGAGGFRKIVGPENCFIMNLYSCAVPEYYDVALKHLNTNMIRPRVACNKCNRNDPNRNAGSGPRCECNVSPGLTSDIGGQIPDLLLSLIDPPAQAQRANGAQSVAEEPTGDMWRNSLDFSTQ